MQNKLEILNKIKKEKVLAVIRLKDSNKVEDAISSLIEGGVSFIEISFTMQYAHTLLENATKKFGNKALIGAGTVIDSETCRLAILSGAKFIVCPYFNKNVIKTANRYSIPVISGFKGIKDIPKALELGVDVFKLFPAREYNKTIIKDIKGPFPNIEIIPFGGVNTENAKEWISSGAMAVGICGEFMGFAENGDFKSVKNSAKDLLKNIK